MNRDLRPSPAFVAGAWIVSIVGIGAYLVGLWNSALPLNERGYYFTLLLFGLFAAVSLQKTVRDHEEGWPVSAIYLNLCWGACLAAVSLLVVGLTRADLLLSEKGFYGIAFLLTMFGAITTQKNLRDLQALRPVEEQEEER